MSGKHRQLVIVSVDGIWNIASRLHIHIFEHISPPEPARVMEQGDVLDEKLLLFAAIKCLITGFEF